MVSRKQSARNEGLLSPDSNIIEDEIFYEFKRLGLEDVVGWGEQGIDRHFTPRKEGAATVKNMPARFMHLDEARLYNKFTMRRTFHLIGKIYAHITAANRELRHLFASENPREFVDPCFHPQFSFRPETHISQRYQKLVGSTRSYLQGTPIFIRYVHMGWCSSSP